MGLFRKKESFYKLVRPDWTDLFTGTVRYTVGKITKPRGSSGFVTADKVRAEVEHTRVVCGPGRLHVWPRVTDAFKYCEFSHLDCRLLRVTVPKGECVLGRDYEKVAVSAVYVAQELPISAGFGPNGRECVAFLRGLPSYPWGQRSDSNVREAQAIVNEHARCLKLPGKTVAIVSNLRAPNRYVPPRPRDPQKEAWLEAVATAHIDRVTVTRGLAIASWVAREIAKGLVCRIAPVVMVDAGDHAQWLITSHLTNRQNPFASLMRLWELGYWVVGVQGDKFVLGTRSGH